MKHSSLSPWKNGLISGFAFFLTVTVLSVGYAALSSGLSSADRVGAGSGLTAASWNKIVDSILELDTRTANVNQDPILSTQPATRYSISAAAGAWNYTGESITVTVPSGPSRRYRVVNQQKINCDVSGQLGVLLSSSSNPTTVSYSWQLGGIPSIASSPIWQTVSSEGIITLAPGTYTYYVMVSNSAACNLQVANESTSNRLNSNLYFDPK